MMSLDAFDPDCIPAPALCQQLPVQLSIPRMTTILQLHSNCSVTECPRSAAAVEFFEGLAKSEIAMANVAWPHPSPAIGYLRADVSRAERHGHEAEIAALARELGYELADIIAAAPDGDEFEDSVLDRAEHSADTVIVPSLGHFTGGQLDAARTLYTVVTVWPERVWDRLR